MDSTPPTHDSPVISDKATASTTRRWCIYGIIAWGLAAGLYLLINTAALGLINMVSSPPSGPRSLPPMIWLRVALLMLPMCVLLYWFRGSRRRGSPVARYGAMIVAMLGIALHFGWVLYFVSVISG